MPLVVGVGQGENFLASDAIALSTVTDKIAYLDNGDVVGLQLHRYRVINSLGQRVERPVTPVAAHAGGIDLAGC